MPYIKGEKRHAIDKHVDNLVRQLSEPGELNYAITVLCDRTLNRALKMDDAELNYTRLNTIIGVLECVKLEFYRRIVVPYENRKCWENGDVYHPKHIAPHPPCDSTEG